MGSSGSGNFSDYSGAPSSGTSSAKTGGSSDEDKCAKAFTSHLEDVQNCEYFQNHGDVPQQNTPIEITFRKPRLVAVTSQGESVGNLPTSFNYLLGCIKSGYTYPGIISSSRLTPIPSAQVTVSPHK